MDQIEAHGKSVDEAIETGLRQLGKSIDEVTIEVLEEGSKGLFGLGGKQTTVRLTVRKTPDSEQPAAFLSKLFELMGMEVDTDIERTEDNLKVKLSGQNMGMLIGYRGETLDALQYLCSLVVNKGREDYTRLILDTENYRTRREETLVRLAKKLSGKAQRTGRKVVLEPMNPYERSVIHSALQSNSFVSTKSEGEDPNRRIVIIPKR